jgi:hypothetical protein
MKTMNLEQMENLLGGVTKDQKCMLYGAGATVGLVTLLFGWPGGAAFLAGGIYAGITYC